MFEYALREIVRRKTRSLATIIGYYVVVLFIMFLLAVLTSVNKKSSTILKGTGTHFIVFVPQCNEDQCENILVDPVHEGFFAGSTKTQMISNSKLEVIRNLESVLDASAYLLFRIRENETLSSVLVGGVPLDGRKSTATNSCSALDIVDGVFLESGKDFSVVLESSYAKSSSFSVGDSIVLAGSIYRVSGIVDSGIRPARADIYMSYEAAKQLVNKRVIEPLGNVSNMFLVESMSSLHHERAVKEVRRVVGEKGLISGYNCFKPAANVMSITGNGFYLTLIISYIGLVMFSIRSQVSAVLERKHDFGILVSMGWELKTIVRQIIYESIFQSFAGWLLSVITAFIVFGLSTFFTSLHVLSVFTLSSLLNITFVTLLLCFIGGAISGVVPAYLIVTKKPAEMLRTLY